MKIYLLYAKENWITDELAKEWIENNREIYTDNLNKADIIWVLSNYIINQIPFQYYKQKKVITTIHHITPWKVNNNQKNHFNNLNIITDVFHTNQDICKNTLKQYVTTPIKVIPFWHNENIWKFLNNKIKLRQKFNFSDDDFLVGSIQKDTEGASISNKTYKPKLEKGPDLFVKAVTLLKKEKYPNLKVILTGYYRQYIINELNKNKINYIYFEKIDFKKLNELYNCLDLCIVGSRVEGGPRAINECSLTKTPLLTTNVGIAPYMVHPKSIFDMNNIETILNCETDIDYNFNQAQKYTIKNYMETFTKNLLNIN